jgi:hypothetical protein
MVAQYSKATPHREPFWFKPVSTFGLFKITTFIGSSLTLVVPAHPLLLSALVLADSALPYGSAYRISGGYVVPRASHRAVTGSACPGRERLMEQPVSSGHSFSCETETHATCRSHKDILGQIDAHCGNRFHGRRSFDDAFQRRSSWHFSMPTVSAVHTIRLTLSCLRQVHSGQSEPRFRPRRLATRPGRPIVSVCRLAG